MRQITQPIAGVPFPQRVPAADPLSSDMATASAHAGLTVDVRSDVNFDDEDGAALDALIDARPDVGVFLSRAWLSGVIAGLPAGSQPAIVMLRADGALKGIAPLCVRRTTTHLRVGFLGGGSVSDRADLLTARGFEASGSDALVSWLGDAFGRRAFVLELRDVPLDSPLWGALYRANGTPLGLAVQPREVHTLPYLDLVEHGPGNGETGGALWNQASSERHRRWLERRGQVTFRCLTDIDEVLAAFETLRSFLHARFADTPGGSALDAPAAAAFHRHVLPLMAREGRLRMLQLSCDDRPVAVQYGLASGTWRGNYFMAYDRAWAGRIHLARVAFTLTIDQFVREGAAEYDFLKGAERVKYLWPVRTRGTLNAEAYPLTMGAQLVRAGAAAREAAAALAKSAGRLLAG